MVWDSLKQSAPKVQASMNIICNLHVVMENTMPALSIERVVENDFDTFFSLICALADFEKLERPDASAEDRLRRDAFQQPARYEAYLLRNPNREAIGYIILFFTYSSFLAQPTLYLEDLFVLPDYRRQGAGTQCMRFLAQRAIQENCGRIEWQVLHWNVNAIDFYNKLGAQHMNEWFPYRLNSEVFAQLAEGSYGE